MRCRSASSWLWMLLLAGSLAAAHPRQLVAPSAQAPPQPVRARPVPQDRYLDLGREKPRAPSSTHYTQSQGPLSRELPGVAAQAASGAGEHRYRDLGRRQPASPEPRSQQDRAPHNQQDRAPHSD